MTDPRKDFEEADLENLRTYPSFYSMDGAHWLMGTEAAVLCVRAAEEIDRLRAALASREETKVLGCAVPDQKPKSAELEPTEGTDDIPFDQWYVNRYTKVLMKSIEEDYIPRICKEGSVCVPLEPIEAARDVLAERQRQITVEGWTADHDDSEHGPAALARAAGCYVLYADAYPNVGEPPPMWPWEPKWWKPKDYRRDLVRAGALIIAAIEFLDRQAALASRPLSQEGREKIGFMCGVDWQHHIENDVEPTSIYRDMDSIKSRRQCIDECGVVRVAIREIDWPMEQNFKAVQSSGRTEVAPQ